MEMDHQHQNDINNEFESINKSIDQLLSMYNFNQTCKYYLNQECIFGEKCLFQHRIIKINKKCKFGINCYYKDTCLYLHPGETIHDHKNHDPNHSHNHNNNGNSTDHNQNARSQGQWQLKQQSTESSQSTQTSNSTVTTTTHVDENNTEKKETLDENDKNEQDSIEAASNTTNAYTITTPPVTNENANQIHTPSRFAQQQIDKIIAKSHQKQKRKRTHPTSKRTESLTTAESPTPTTQSTKAKIATTTTATHTNVNINANPNASHTSQPSNAHIKSTATPNEKNNENEVKTSDNATNVLSDRPNYDLPKWLRTKKNKLIMSLVIIAAGEEYRHFELKTDFRLDYYTNEYRMYERIISKDGFYPDASNSIRKISQVDLVGHIQDDIIGPARTALRLLLTKMKSTYMKDIVKYGETERIQNGIWNKIVSHYISQQFLEIMDKAINILWEKDGNSAINAALECTGEYIYKSTSEYNVHPMIIFLANTYQVYPLIRV